MTEQLQEAIAVLCDELGLPTAQINSSGLYIVRVDGKELRILTLRDGKVVLLGVIGVLATIAESRRESADSLLRNCLILHGARLERLGTPEVLTLDDTELVLWRKFEPFGISISEFLQASESVLNEVEFWQNWLSAA